MKKQIKNHDLKPMSYSEAMDIQKSVKSDVCVVERADGKQILINTTTLASHLERGFKFVKEGDAPKKADKADATKAPAAVKKVAK